MRLFINAVFAATVGYTLSVLINSSVSAATLVGFGIEVTIGDRFQMFATEWLGLASTYLLIYVLLHTVVFLLVNHFVCNTRESRRPRSAQWRSHGTSSSTSRFASPRSFPSSRTGSS